MKGGLLEREIGFFHALREAGLNISLAEVLDATRALGVVDLLDREHLRAAYAATVLKRPAHRRTFDTLFDLWFPPVIGRARPRARCPTGEVDLDELDGDGPPDTEALRALLQGPAARRRRGRDARLRARDASATSVAPTPQPGRQSWFSYRVLRGLSPETLMASLLEAMLAGQERGGLAEKVARQTITERIRQFQEMVESEVRRRLAEDRGVEAAQQDRRAAARRAGRLPARQPQRHGRAAPPGLPARPAARHPADRASAGSAAPGGSTSAAPSGRRSRTGGVPLVTHHRPHKPHKPELVVHLRRVRAPSPASRTSR